MPTLIEIAESRPDVLGTAKAQGGDPFTAGTEANRWLNDWWNTAGKSEFPGVELTQPITPESLENKVKFDLTGTPVNNIDESGLAVAGAEEQKNQDEIAAKAAVEAEKARETTAAGDITGILKELEEEPTAQLAGEQEAGISAFKQQQADVGGQIAIKTAEYRQLEQQEEQFKTLREGIPGFTLSEISGQQAQITREFRSRKNAAASELALLQAESLAISGKQGAAQAAVDRAVSLKYDTLRLELDTKKFLFDMIREDLTKAEQQQLAIQEAIVAQQEADLKYQQDIDKAENKAKLDLITKYKVGSMDMTLEELTSLAQGTATYRKETRIAPTGGGLTPNQKDYNFAVSQGFTGTFAEWQGKDGSGIEYEFSSGATGRLLAAGFTSNVISAIQKDLSNGVSIDNIVSGFEGASDEQITALRDSVSGKTVSTIKEEEEQKQRTWSDEEIREQIIKDYNNDFSRNNIMGEFNRSNELTNADKERAKFILDEMWTAGEDKINKQWR